VRAGCSPRKAGCAGQALPSMRASLVYVHLGRELPRYLADSISQARRFNADTPIFVVAESAALDRADAIQRNGVIAVRLEELAPSKPHGRFRRISRLDRHFREGFWTYTTERFFALERLARAFTLREFIHIENDVMIYFDIAEMTGRLAPLYPNLASTFPNDELCVASLLYVANAESLVPLLDYINAQVGRWFSRPANEMEMIGRYRRLRGPTFIDTLPIVPPEYPGPLCSRNGQVPRRSADCWNHFDVLQGLFDASALGQYLGGIDPRNTAEIETVGYINECSIFDPSLCRLDFSRDGRGRRFPTLSAGGLAWPVYNLHIHSKTLAPFAS